MVTKLTDEKMKSGYLESLKLKKTRIKVPIFGTTIVFLCIFSFYTGTVLSRMSNMIKDPEQRVFDSNVVAGAELSNHENNYEEETIKDKVDREVISAKKELKRNDIEFVSIEKIKDSEKIVFDSNMVVDVESPTHQNDHREEIVKDKVDREVISYKKELKRNDTEFVSIEKIKDSEKIVLESNEVVSTESFTHKNDNEEVTTEDKVDREVILIKKKSKPDDIEFVSYEQFWDSASSEVVQNQIKQQDDAPPEHQWLRGSNAEKEYNPKLDQTIPKIINKVYIEKDGMFPSKEEMSRTGNLVEAHHSWSLHNPGYKIRYFNLNLCRQYLKENFHYVFLRAFDCIEAFSGKVNLFRMLVVYAEGGWYSDWKQVSLQTNLLDTFGADVDFFGLWDHGHSGLRADKCVQNCFFGAVPRHPLIGRMIQTILTNVKNEVYRKHALYTTGPCVFGITYEKYIQKENPNKERMRMGYFNSNLKISLLEDSKGTIFIQHKCTGCGSDQNWSKGNNYNTLHAKREYYCEDAKSLFNMAVTNIEDGQMML